MSTQQLIHFVVKKYVCIQNASLNSYLKIIKGICMSSCSYHYQTTKSWGTSIFGLHFKMHLVTILHVFHLWRCKVNSLVANHVDPRLIICSMIHCFTIIIVQVETLKVHYIEMSYVCVATQMHNCVCCVHGFVN